LLGTDADEGTTAGLAGGDDEGTTVVGPVDGVTVAGVTEGVAVDDGEMVVAGTVAIRTVCVADGVGVGLLDGASDGSVVPPVREVPWPGLFCTMFAMGLPAAPSIPVSRRTAIPNTRKLPRPAAMYTFGDSRCLAGVEARTAAAAFAGDIPRAR
jgi:hypothetical protein